MINSCNLNNNNFFYLTGINKSCVIEKEKSKSCVSICVFGLPLAELGQTRGGLDHN